MLQSKVLTRFLNLRRELLMTLDLQMDFFGKRRDADDAFAADVGVQRISITLNSR
jgi:hypothetical protein